MGVLKFMLRSKKSVRVAGQRIPEIRFEDQSLTSFSGVVLLQRLFEVLDLRVHLRACVRHLRSSASYHRATMVDLLIVHPCSAGADCATSTTTGAIPW